MPAMAVWLLAWGLRLGLEALGSTPLLAWVVAALTGLVGSAWGQTPVRRWMIALGFPLSWGLATGMLPLSSWWWLALLSVLLLLYPPSTWKDAPLFPTPPQAFDGLRDVVSLPWAGHVLDAGCGLGHGLVALERAWPDVHLHGIERSGPLAWACRWRCRFATVERGDMWTADWGRYDMVYLFQRPETMPRAMAKAAQELRCGAWLASLEFADPAWIPDQVWNCPDGRSLYLYHAPLRSNKPEQA